MHKYSHGKVCAKHELECNYLSYVCDIGVDNDVVDVRVEYYVVCSGSSAWAKPGVDYV